MEPKERTEGLSPVEKRRLLDELHAALDFLPDASPKDVDNKENSYPYSSKIKFSLSDRLFSWNVVITFNSKSLIKEDKEEK